MQATHAINISKTCTSHAILCDYHNYKPMCVLYANKFCHDKELEDELANRKGSKITCPLAQPVWKVLKEECAIRYSSMQYHTGSDRGNKLTAAVLS